MSSSYSVYRNILHIFKSYTCCIHLFLKLLMEFYKFTIHALLSTAQLSSYAGSHKIYICALFQIFLMLCILNFMM